VRHGHIRVSYCALSRGGERASTKINGCWPHRRKVKSSTRLAQLDRRRANHFTVGIPLEREEEPISRRSESGKLFRRKDL
jgi:hypothetical protein